MNTKVLLSSLLVLGGVCAPLLQAQPAPRQNNAARRDWQADRQRTGQVVQQRTSYTPLTLNGMIGSGPNLEVSLTNPETKESHWVRVRDRKARWYVESANPPARSVVVRLDGIPLQLRMVANTGEPMSISPQPVQLSAQEAEARTIGGLNAKTIAAEMIARRASGQPPSREEMQQFRQQVDSLTTEQRSTFFTELRSEMQKNGADFGPPMAGGRQTTANSTVTISAAESGGGNQGGANSGPPAR